MNSRKIGENVKIFCEKCGFVKNASLEHYPNKQIAKVIYSFCPKCPPYTSAIPTKHFFDEDGNKIYWHEVK